MHEYFVSLKFVKILHKSEDVAIQKLQIQAPKTKAYAAYYELNRHKPRKSFSIEYFW